MSTTRSVREQVVALRGGGGVVLGARDVVVASGEAVVDYLQGQLSQDVAALVPGEPAWSFVLQPQGKVDAWFRITRLADDSFLLDVDGGFGPGFVARLERFRLRTPVSFEAADWRWVAIRGAACEEPPQSSDPQQGVAVPVDLPGNRGWDLLGPSAAAPPGLLECGPDALEVLRIEAGVPRMGAELDESTIPAETGVVPMSVSFTKGCYTGQELVARIDSRGGRTPRRLVGLRCEGDEVPRPGARLEVDGAEVGTVTSSAAGGSHGGAVALAYLARGVDVPVEVTTAGHEDMVRALAVELPMVTS